MIQLIYGKKGSGKTKRLIDMVNAELEATKGDVVFMDDDKRYMYDVKPQIRFVDVREYDIDNADKLYGFLAGMMAQDYDISAIYIDAFVKMINSTTTEIESVIRALEGITNKNDVKAVINVSGDASEASDYIKGLMI